MAHPPGGARHRTASAKLHTRARTAHSMQSGNMGRMGPLALTGDNVVDDRETLRMTLRFYTPDRASCGWAGRGHRWCKIWLLPALLSGWARSGTCVYGCVSASSAGKVGINYFGILGRFYTPDRASCGWAGRGHRWCKMWLLPALLSGWARSGTCVYGCVSASSAGKVGINYFGIFGSFYTPD